MICEGFVQMLDLQTEEANSDDLVLERIWLSLKAGCVDLTEVVNALVKLARRRQSRVAGRAALTIVLKGKSRSLTNLCRASLRIIQFA